MNIVQHKKGDFAGMTNIRFIGWSRSYFAEDGWHEVGTYRIVPAPTTKMIVVHSMCLKVKTMSAYTLETREVA